MNSARQLCRASSSLARTVILTVCPVCGGKVTPTQFAAIVVENRRERRPVIPPHIRNQHGEMKVKVAASKDRYPR